jgi:hypothetical protein
MKTDLRRQITALNADTISWIDFYQGDAKIELVFNLAGQDRLFFQWNACQHDISEHLNSNYNYKRWMMTFRISQ